MSGFPRVQPKPERIPPGGGKDVAVDSEDEPIPGHIRRRVWLIVAVAFIAPASTDDYRSHLSLLTPR